MKDSTYSRYAKPTFVKLASLALPTVVLLASPLLAQPSSPSKQPVDLVRYERRRQHLQLEVMENLENQFTVGYKANVPLPDSDGDSAIDIHQGPVIKTHVATNLAIVGRGFFQLEDGSYTRDGRFAFHQGKLQTIGTTRKAVLGFPLDAQGNLKGDAGAFELKFDETLKLYAGLYHRIGIDRLGRVYGLTVRTDTVSELSVESSAPLFQIGLVDFESPQYLRRVDAAHFRSSKRTGKVYVGLPGQGNLGEIASEFLEMSNVDFKEQSYWLGWLERGRFEPPFPSADERVRRSTKAK
jgi:flagellar basal body rod protein FlgG